MTLKKRNFKQNGNENTIHQNAWNVAKAVLNRIFVALNAYFSKGKSLKSIKLHLKNLR